MPQPPRIIAEPQLPGPVTGRNDAQYLQPPRPQLLESQPQHPEQTRQPDQIHTGYPEISAPPPQLQCLGCKRTESPQWWTRLARSGTFCNDCCLVMARKTQLEDPQSPNKRPAATNNCRECHRAPGATHKWRMGPDSPHTLCSSCGQRWARVTRNQAKAAAARRREMRAGPSTSQINNGEGPALSHGTDEQHQAALPKEVSSSNMPSHPSQIS